jgi:hypothetical protein
MAPRSESSVPSFFPIQLCLLVYPQTPNAQGTHSEAKRVTMVRMRAVLRPVVTLDKRDYQA